MNSIGDYAKVVQAGIYLAVIFTLRRIALVYVLRSGGCLASARD